MKKLLLTVSLISLAFISFSQKVDLDKFNFTFEYRDLPAKPQNPEYKTYSVSVNTSETVRSNYGTNGLEDAVKLQGWKKVSDTKGHLIVNVSLGDLDITSSQVTERVDIQKDKDGKETGRKYYYKVDVAYNWSGSASVKDYKDAAIGTSGYGGTAETWSSTEYSTRKEASDYYNNNRSAIRNKLLTEKVNTALSDLSTWLSNNYGYSTRKDYEFLWILDSKKHPEYQSQHDGYEAFKAAMATVTADNLSAETKEKFAAAIKYFDGVPARFATEDKGDKKLRYAAFYNKAKIYLYLDNPEAAIKEADALIANGYDDGDGKRIKKDAEALIDLFKKNNSNSRHFAIDVSGYTPPASN